MPDVHDIKDAVRSRYAQAAARLETAAPPTCTPASSSCCGGAPAPVETPASSSERLGYAAEDLGSIPDGADLGLGCGNPLAILDLREGETVLDLGSGGGIDCFIAAKRVGPTGRVIGVDMTPEMVARARRNAERGGHTNVEFRLGEIEHLPVADDSVDALISNCVINLVPDKRQVFADAFRALKPGGRLSVSDMVTLTEMPPMIRESIDAYVACLGGAVTLDEYVGMIAEAGFTDVRVTSEKAFDLGDVEMRDQAEDLGRRVGATQEEVRSAASNFRSVRVSATKPA